MALHNVCKTDELAPGALKAARVNGEGILVYRLDNDYYATQASCTHLFAPLAKGKIIDGCKIQCPFHRARFDIRTGEVVDWANFPPGIQVLNVVRGEKKLKTYPVKVADGWVQVEA
jgi:nitrite reductase/ring-hydroxylating ferredoxin subunit